MVLRNGIYMDEEFRPRGPRVGYVMTVFACLAVMWAIALIWVSR